VALLNAMMNVIVSEKLHNEPFIRERTEDFAALVEVIRDFTPEKAEAITTVPAEAVRQAARLYATALSSSIIYSMGITQHTTGTDNVLTANPPVDGQRARNPGVGEGADKTTFRARATWGPCRTSTPATSPWKTP
jgi:predicted molibdopterin-dependent oxidoreductase YjgC